MRLKIILTVFICYIELLLIAVRSKVMSYIDTHYAWWGKLMDAIEERWWLLGVTIVLFYSVIVYYSWLEFERKKGSLIECRYLLRQVFCYYFIQTCRNRR